MVKLAAALLFLALLRVGYGASDLFAEKVFLEELRSVEGHVSYVDSVMLTLTYDQDAIEGSSREMVFQRNSDIRFLGGQRWEDIKRNDNLEIDYLAVIDEFRPVQKEDSTAADRSVVERKVKQIKFKESKTTSLGS